MNNVAVYTKMKLKTYPFDSAYCTDSLNALLSGIIVNKEDIVVFYYTGHGFMYQNQVSAYPHLAFGPVVNQGISYPGLEAIHHVLVVKKGRLTITLGYLCSSKIDTLIPTIGTQAPV